MANEEEANTARQAHGRELLKRGAHAIGVEKGTSYGKPGWVVVAHVAPGAKADFPSSLSPSPQDGGDKVPLVIKRTEQFTPE
jgi:hypothetical protein